MPLPSSKFCSLAGAKTPLAMKGCQRVSVGGGLSGSGDSNYSSFVVLVLVLEFVTQIILTKCSVHFLFGCNFQ